MDSSRDRSSRAGRPPAEPSLQPDDWTPTTAPPGWLIDVDAASEARDLDRLQGDTDMLLQLQLAGYTGRTWAYFSRVLARYGFAVLRAWMLRGLMLKKCKEKGLRGLPRNGLGHLSMPDIEELAGETVAVAIYYFRERVLVANGWDPRRGASLRTFFIGQCLIQFPSVYRRWRAESSHPHEDVVEEVPDKANRDDPAGTVVNRTQIDEALAALDDRTAQVLRLFAEDMHQHDIARRSGLTLRAVEAILYRHRQRQNQRKGA